MISYERKKIFNVKKNNIFKLNNFLKNNFLTPNEAKKHNIKKPDLLNIMKIQNPEKRSNNIICEGKKPKCPNALFEDANVSVWYSGK